MLKYLYLSGNRLTGVIPSSWDSLVSLQVMGLSSNKLGGEVPEFTKAMGLSTITLSDNKFTGTLPTFASLTRLELLDLSYNELSGPLKSWSYLKSLRDINLSFNNLEGDLSNWKPLPSENSTIPKRIDLSHNELSGTTIPWTNIRASTINLSHNRISGNLKEILDTLASTLVGGKRQLIAASSSNMATSTKDNLEELNLAGNKLTGSLNLTQLYAFESLQFLNLANNTLSGRFVVPPNLQSKLKSLDISNNQFHGIFGAAHDPFSPLESFDTVYYGYGADESFMNNFNDGKENVYINAAKNGFSCPFPKHSENIILIKTACGISDMAIVIAILAGCMVVPVALLGGLLYCLYKRGSLKSCCTCCNGVNAKMPKKMKSCCDRVYATYRKVGPRVIFGYTVYLALAAYFVWDVYVDVVMYQQQLQASSSVSSGGYCAALNEPLYFVAQVPLRELPPSRNFVDGRGEPAVEVWERGVYNDNLTTTPKKSVPKNEFFTSVKKCYIQCKVFLV
jgi:hypothetical protein